MGFGLCDLLAPMTPDEFIAGSWERAPLVIRGAHDKFAELLDLDTFLAVISDPRESEDGRAVRLKAGTQDARGDHVELAIVAAQVPQLVRAGMTIQAEDLDAHHPHFAALIADVRATLGIAAPMDVGAFLSPDGSGYGLHYDATAMWTLQVEGEKVWHYGTVPAVPFPPFNRVATAAERTSITDLAEVRLGPGDLLYLPPGTWHRARAVGRSLHASLTIRAADPFDLVRDALAPLRDDARWRRMPNGDAARVAGELAERLAELRVAIAELSVERLAEAWQARVAPRVAPIRRGEALARVASVRIVPGTADALGLEVGGAVLASLPAHAAGFLARLVETPRFSADDALGWDPDYTWDDVEAVLRVLVELGILFREPA